MFITQNFESSPDDDTSSSSTPLQWVSNNGENLAECQGDCDGDSDCIGDLICWQRGDDSDPIPGCTGDLLAIDAANSDSGTDYCYNPNATIVPTSDPTTASGEPTTYPTADPDSSTHCAYNMDGGGWILVRHTYNKWFDANDDLTGTADYGVVSGPLSDNEFAIPFNATNDTQFLFSKGNCEEWLITTYDQFGYKRDGAYYGVILKSCNSNVSYTAKWYNREEYDEDPWY